MKDEIKKELEAGKSLEEAIKSIDLDTFLKETWKDVIEEGRTMVVMQGCLEKGPVTRKMGNLNLCDNPNCKSCMDWKREFKDV